MHGIMRGAQLKGSGAAHSTELPAGISIDDLPGLSNKSVKK